MRALELVIPVFLSLPLSCLAPPGFNSPSIKWDINIYPRVWWGLNNIMPVISLEYWHLISKSFPPPFPCPMSLTLDPWPDSRRTGDSASFQDSLL